MVEWLILAVPWGCLRFVIVAFPDHIQLLFLKSVGKEMTIECYMYIFKELDKRITA